MQELFRILKERYEENKASMLVTVVDGSGSIPRKAGAYMIVGDEAQNLRNDRWRKYGVSGDFKRSESRSGEAQSFAGIYSYAE